MLLWVVVFGAVALAGLVMLVGYAVWLWHKASDVMSEVAMVAGQAERFATLLDQVQASSSYGGTGPTARRRMSSAVVDEHHG